MAEYSIHEVLSGAVRGVSAPTGRHQQSVLYLTPHSSSENLLIRVLLGSCRLEFWRYGLQWSQSENFMILGVPASTFGTRNDFQRYLKQKGIPLKELDAHLRRNIRQEGFYKEILTEVILALLRREKKEHTLAFLHIYRFLERISFAFPVIYAARASDFKAAYTTLKEYLGGTADKGELAFFKKFTETSINPILSGATANITLAHLDPLDRGSVFTILKRFIPDTVIQSEVPDQAVEIPYSAVLDLLINLRNRFFHFSSNHTQNINSVDLPVSDHLFGCVNDIFLNWLAAIYFEILEDLVAR